MMQQNSVRPSNAIPIAQGFNPMGLTDDEVHLDWYLLNKGDPIQPGDGFYHPDYQGFMAYECRPAIFTGCGKEGDRHFVPKKECVHTWPWRRRKTPAHESEAAQE